MLKIPNNQPLRLQMDLALFTRLSYKLTDRKRTLQIIGILNSPGLRIFVSSRYGPKSFFLSLPAPHPRSKAQWIKHSPGTQAAGVWTQKLPKFIALLSSWVLPPCALSLSQCLLSHAPALILVTGKVKGEELW